MSLSHVFAPESIRIKSLLHFISSMHSLLFIYSSRLVFLGKKTITKRAPRHPYRTRSKSRTMGDKEETKEQMKANMSALKE